MGLFFEPEDFDSWMVRIFQDAWDVGCEHGRPHPEGFKDREAAAFGKGREEAKVGFLVKPEKGRGLRGFVPCYGKPV